MKTLILGIGNPILSDDGIGIRVARRFKENNPALEVVETSEVGMALLEILNDHDRAIIIDSIKTDGGIPGELYKLDLADLKFSTNFPTSHGIGIATAVELGQQLGYKMPKYVSVYAVEIKDNTTFSEQCTKEIEACIPGIFNQIIEAETM